MHKGHRSRLIGKIANGDSLYEHELLEVLLFNACPRKDVNYIAHNLINKFGGIRGVLHASEQELVKVEGVGKSIAEYLTCLGKCMDKVNGSESFAVVKSTAEFKQFVTARMSHGKENFGELYCLDKDGRIRRACTLSDGVGGSGKISVESVLKFVSVYKPYGVYAAFCSAGENPSPSEEDDGNVACIRFACELGGVRFFDCCLIGSNGQIYSYFVGDRLFSHLTDGGCFNPRRRGGRRCVRRE